MLNHTGVPSLCKQHIPNTLPGLSKCFTWFNMYNICTYGFNIITIYLIPNFKVICSQNTYNWMQVNWLSSDGTLVTQRWCIELLMSPSCCCKPGSLPILDKCCHITNKSCEVWCCRYVWTDCLDYSC